MQNSIKADIVICGAGIAGVAAAYHLSVHQGIKNVVLVDERPPLSLTSDKSTECYRNWWPDSAMAALGNRSIDLLEALAQATQNAFQMNRRGYLFATANNVEGLTRTAHHAAAMGAGTLRVHRGLPGDPTYIPAPPSGYKGLPAGIDLIHDRDLIRRHFPYLSNKTMAVAHARRCGWLSAQQLGMTMLGAARAHGVTLISGRMTGVDTAGERVNSVSIETHKGTVNVATPVLVNAAGPFAGTVNEMLGVALPISVEGHVKITFADPHGAMPREAPLVIWTDPVCLPWDGAERTELAQSHETRVLLEPYGAGVHGRPEGSGNTTLLYWTYAPGSSEAIYPVPYDPAYPEIVLRGMSVMLPAMAAYFGRQPKPFIDGGYYTQTPENRPLIGPLPLHGAFICSAFSGFGIMMSMAAGELLAAHITGSPQPDYAPAFAPARYDDPDYQKRLADWPDNGEL
jgi:glycine/D-amino acid oxidase-like deaminating enzyme